MQKRVRYPVRHALAACMVVLLSSGCYHARIETGLQPSGQTVERSFAHSWLAGLVPPSTVETMGRCPDGVARVDTQLSFVNQLVSVLTGGIYTPMSIRVSCAAAREDAEETAALPVIDREEDAVQAISRGESFLVEVR